MPQDLTIPLRLFCEICGIHDAGELIQRTFDQYFMRFWFRDWHRNEGEILDLVISYGFHFCGDGVFIRFCCRAVHGMFGIR